MLILQNKLYRWLFQGHSSSDIFETLHHYNRTWGLPIHIDIKHDRDFHSVRFERSRSNRLLDRAHVKNKKK